MAVSSIYPIEGEPIVRGDPLMIPVDINVNGVPQDLTDWEWRAHIRRSPDAALLMQFTIEAVIPPEGTVPSRLLLTLTPEQTRLLKTGMVADLEQITSAISAGPSDPDETADEPVDGPTTIRTWWRITRLIVDKDMSHA
jgi:hypothetical protein